MQPICVFLILTTVLIVPGYTLKCYQCIDCDIKKFKPQECVFAPGLNLDLKSLKELVSSNKSRTLQNADHLEVSPSPRERGLYDKSCFKATFKDNGHTTVHGCFLGEMRTACDYLTAGYLNTDCYVCNTDGCNGGSRFFGFSLSALILSMIFVKVTF